MSLQHSKQLSDHPLASIIGRRIILILVIISSTITLLSTFLQLYADYTREVNAVEARHAELKQVHAESLAINLWEFNESQLKLRLEGLVKLPGLAYIKVTSNTGNQYWDAGDAVDGDLFDSNIPLVYEGPGSQTPFVLGTLHVESSAEEIYQQLLKTFTSLLLINGIKTFIVSAMVLWVFHLSVNRRIFSIMRYLERYRPSQKHVPLELEKPAFITVKEDELDILGLAVNQLSQKMNQLYSEIEQEKNRFSDFANVASDWLWETDAEGNLVFASEQMLSQLDHDADDLSANNNLSQLLDTPLLQVGFERKENFHDLEIQLQLHGERHYFVFQGLAQFDLGRFIGFRGTAVDISQQKKAQNALQELNETLELRVQKRTEQLKNSLEELELTQNQLIEREKMASLANLVAGIAHEINTPLGVAVTASSMLDHSDENPDLEAVELIDNNLQRVVRLVQMFKQTAVTTNQTPVEKVYLRELFNDLSLGLQQSLTEKRASISANVDDSLSWNTVPASWLQVIGQLINNSLIHGFSQADDDNKITLQAYIEGSELVVEYTDNGVELRLIC
jgi:signal transduction histidine kinase